MVEHHNGTICFEDGRISSSRCIFHGENPLDFVFPLFMFQVIASFVISSAFYFVLRPFQTPKFVSSCLSGIVLGPSVLGQIPGFMKMFYPDKEMLLLETVSTFAIMFYVLLLIVKLDLTTILKTARHACSIGIMSFVVPILVMACFYLLVQDFLPGMKGGTAAFTTFSMMTANSLSDTVNAMNELNYLTSELGQLAMSSAVLNEIIMWIISVVLNPSGSLQTVHNLGYFFAFALLVFCIMRPTVLWIVKITPEGKSVSEGAIIGLLLISAIVGLVADFLGMTFLPGILLMGLIIPGGPPLGSALIEKSELMVQEFFLHFLFLSIGRIIDVSQIRDWKEFLAMLLLIIAAYFGKFLAVCFGSLHFKMSFRNVLLLGLMLQIRGPIEIIFLMKKLAAKDIDPQIFAMLVIFSLLSTATGAHLLHNFYTPNVRLEVSLFSKLSMRSFLLAPSGGEFRILSCIHQEDDVHTTISLLEAINPTEKNPVSAYIIHALELLGQATPLLEPYRYEKNFRNNSTDRIMRAFINYSTDATKSLAVLPFTLVAPYKSMHEPICRHILVNHVPLIILPFHETQAMGVKNNIRNLNNSFIGFAPCTVGIMVRRKNNNGALHPRRVKHNSSFSYNVAVIFFGGDDDREALALAYRMSSHPGVSITVLRIVYTENQEKDGAQKLLDDKMFKEFKKRNAGNTFVRCNEVYVENIVEIISVINSLTGRYDLVMVGRRPEASAKFEEDAGKWVEYPELGVIGDLVASPDFCEDVGCVLVLQHHVGGDGNGLVYNEPNSIVGMEGGSSYAYQNFS